ncbi:MAG: GNAT family N-acetyltransferase [Pirellulales bacterium]|nr:GNAT family N-acetyltransferase [Pirellulales bacterium]
MSPEVVACPAHLQRTALECLFGDWVPNLRHDQVAFLLDTARDGGLDNLLAVVSDGQLAGAVLGRPLGGHAALVWPPRLTTGKTIERIGGDRIEAGRTIDQLLCSALLTQLLQRLRTAGAVLVQALLTPGAANDEALLSNAGFSLLADLDYMVGFNRLAPDDSSPLVFEAYAPRSHTRFKQLVERTYEGSLDCPALDGLRDVDDVLAGYRVTGRFDPRHWLLAHVEGVDLGCLVLADDPRLDQWELIYMGLVPEARGRRWGRLLVAHAQRLSARAGRKRMMLSVDRANAPAVRTYTHLGFVRCDERRVMFRTLADRKN